MKKIGLIITEKDGNQRHAEFMEHIVIGRHSRKSTADIKIKDDDMSSVHLKIYQEKDGKVYIKDLESKNGTNLNKSLVRDSRLFVNDEVIVGNTKISIDRSSISLVQKATIGIRTTGDNPNDITLRS